MNRIGIVVLLAVGLSASAFAADFAGTWNVTIKSPMGDRAAQLVVNADGTGTFDGKPTTVIVDGDSLSFEATRTTQMGEMKMKYDGKLAEGKIDGTMAMVGMPAGGGGPAGPGGGGPGGGGPGGPGGGMSPPTWSAVRAQ